MTSRRLALFLVAFTAILFSTTATQAVVTYETVTIANPGNLGWDVDPLDPETLPGRGSVDYTFEMGKYEVTNTDYTDFLNTVDPTAANDLELYQNGQRNYGVKTDSALAEGSRYYTDTGKENWPVCYVNLYSMMRFANWMTNGQGSGSTETGSYTMIGGAIPTNDTSDTPLVRNSLAEWVVPGYDEWAKAAFYDPRDLSSGGPVDGGGWWNYANRSSDVPVDEVPPGGANSANYNLVVGHATDVGSYPNSSSYYGTFDQNGNIMEMTDTHSGGGSFASGPWRWKTGAHWRGSASFMPKGTTPNSGPDSKGNGLGFRLANVPPSGALCDLDGNGICDIGDVNTLVGGGSAAIDTWLADAATENGFSTAYLPSDSDLDRDVDLTDYNVLAGNFNPTGSGYTFSQGDGNGDGTVDLSDYNSLAVVFNPVGYGGAAAVPEPVSLVLFSLGTVLVLFRRRRAA